jgi:mannose-6-phosphate isomerase-like protein (cupin superfamily)
LELPEGLINQASAGWATYGTFSEDNEMDIKDVFAVAEFSTEKMRKINLFETKNFFCDVYCLEPGQEQKVHAHDEEDKIYYVLAGRGSFVVGDETRELGERHIVMAPAGSAHGVKNTGGERLTLLVFMTPNPNFK